MTGCLRADCTVLMHIFMHKQEQEEAHNSNVGAPLYLIASTERNVHHTRNIIGMSTSESPLLRTVHYSMVISMRKLDNRYV